MYKKITALILCFALSGILLTGAFETGAAADVCAVCLSSDGDDSNSGITADKPLKTLKAAVNTVNRLELVGYNRVINIVKCGWNGISFDMSGCTPYTEMITLTAPSGLTVWSTSDMYLAGPLTLDADYGNSRTQSALNIYTGGYPFTLLSKDQKGNSNIYAGFNSRLGLTADEESGNIEWKSDLKITLAGEREMTVGKVIAGNCSDPGHNVIYGTADILIDNPNLTVSSLKLGSNGNFTNTGTQSNRFKGISMTVNSVKEIATLEGATYYNAVYTEELRLIFNNGTADRITDTLIYGKYGNTNIQAAKKWIVKNGTDTPIKAGAEPGVFTVVGGSAVIFPAGRLTDCPAQEHVLYLAEQAYDAPFSTPRALGRNYLIHAMGEKTLVAQCRAGSGGTWDGTTENLKHGWSPVFVHDDGTPGARALIERGAAAVRTLGRLDELQPEQLHF